MTSARIVHVGRPVDEEGLGLFWFQGLPRVGDQIWLDLVEKSEDVLLEVDFRTLCVVDTVVWEIVNLESASACYRACLHVATHADHQS